MWLHEVTDEARREWIYNARQAPAVCDTVANQNTDSEYEGPSTFRL